MSLIADPFLNRYHVAGLRAYGFFPERCSSACSSQYHIPPLTNTAITSAREFYRLTQRWFHLLWSGSRLLQAACRRQFSPSCYSSPLAVTSIIRCTNNSRRAHKRESSSCRTTSPFATTLTDAVRHSRTIDLCSVVYYTLPCCFLSCRWLDTGSSRLVGHSLSSGSC
jgi:hypothetical protein